MRLADHETLDKSVTIAYVLSPFIAFVGIVGASAAIYGIHPDSSLPSVHEISTTYRDNQIKCISEHVLRISLNEGKQVFVPVIDCSESTIQINP